MANQCHPRDGAAAAICQIALNTPGIQKIHGYVNKLIKSGITRNLAAQQASGLKTGDLATQHTSGSKRYPKIMICLEK